jgi:hypothetical protein
VDRVSIPDIGKLLLVSGVVIAAVGGALVLGARLGLGRLPGDITTRGGSFTFVFPLVTCLVVSIVLTIVLNVILRIR